MWCTFLVTLLLLVIATVTDGTIARCQANCVASDRKVGPTKPQFTRPHPWKKAPFPFPFDGFCKLGCQLFFSEEPYNVTCKRACDYSYRYGITVEYSDLGEVAKLECRDGCDIALLTCQTGYYCTGGKMLACPPGRFRESQTTNVTTCIDCPLGRYRDRDKGTSADTCALCPIGTYANVTGSTDISACLKCPAGQTAEEEGMALCKCITPYSCDLSIELEENSTQYYSNGVDFFRETVPFIGRW